MLDELQGQDKLPNLHSASFEFNPFHEIGVPEHELDVLNQLQICYPIRNRTKAQNTNITNFQFENGLKEQTFLLSFDVDAVADILVNKDSTKSSYLFRINGKVHSHEDVFSDGIYYNLKGGKLLNCSLQQVNDNLKTSLNQPSRLQASWFRQNHTVKVTNLPKSFGCELHFDTQSIYRNKLKLDVLKEQFMAHDLNCIPAKYLPFKPIMLQDLGAHVSKMYFVFNINDELIKEQNFF